jgi:opacity protein-like surface antigen
MARSKLYALARVATLVASVGAPGLAVAADLLPPPPPPPPPPVDFAGGWYLRGDVGASVYTTPKYSAVGLPDTIFFNQDQSGGFFAGAGVGYQFNAFFRGDITGEFRATDLRLGAINEYNDGNLSYRNFNFVNGHYNAAVVLANGYFDLGTWCGVTPFIGGGVGVAFNHFNGFTDSGVTNFYTPQAYNNVTTPGFFKAKSTESFAWALHAGLAYDVTPNFKVELAYRYLNTGHAQTGGLTCLDVINGYDCKTVLKAKDLEAHDIKIGLRYMLGSTFIAPLPPLMQEPLVRKY